MIMFYYPSLVIKKELFSLLKQSIKMVGKSPRYKNKTK